MHKFLIDFVRQSGSRGLVLRGLVLLSLTVGARTALAQPQIRKDGTAVVLQDYARVPLSSRTTGNYPPPIDFSNQLGRANRLRSEPPNAPNSSSRFFVNDQNRNLYILDKVSKTFTPYINFEEVFPNFVNADWAHGLGTFIFDPDYAANGKFYTIHVEDPNKTPSAAPTNARLPGLDLTGYATTPAINPPTGTVIRQSILAEWTDTNINNSTFEGTAREILRVGLVSLVHSVADLLFNPTAYAGYDDYRNLYISVGDDKAGEIYGVTHTIPQRLDALGGKILRITPDITLRPGDELAANGRYRIPTSGSNPNPFASLSLSGLKKEIYAYGFRNPHRMSWDPISNKLIVDDIGLDTWEEVDIITKGSNYGYAEREGIEQLLVTNDNNNGKTGSQTNPPTPFPNPDALTVAGIATPVTPVYPAAAYGHQDGDAISSGFVYRGSLMPQLTDKYVFGDITTGRLFYADLADIIANDDGSRTTLATIHELQVVFDSPYDNPGQGLVNRRLFDIVADEYAHRGGSIPPYVLPCCATVTSGNDPDGVPYGGGRADIRLALGGDGEIYVLSKSDGMVRLLAGTPPTVAVAARANPNPVTGTTTSLSVLGADDGGEANLTYTWSTTGTPPAPVSFSANGTNAAKTTNATFSAAGAYAFRVRITDTTGFSTASDVTVIVQGGAAATIFSPSAAPTTFYSGSSPVELGVKFRSDANGSITGIRFYKGSGDTNVHTGSLWSSTGTLLATGMFSGEGASGWQQLNFSAPVAITANTTYVASYHSAGAFYYSYAYFQYAGVDNAPLHALRDGADGPDGVYVYGSGSIFPNQSYLSSNYWVDVVFAQSGPAGPPQSIVAFSGTPQSTAVGTPFAGALQAKVTDASSNPVANVSVTFTAPSSGSTATFGGSNIAIAVTNAAGIATSPVPAANSTTGSYTVTASVTGLTAATFTLTNTATVTAATIFSPSAAPTTFYSGSSPVELGVKFRSDANGSITGIRFYKGSGDTGAHTGSLWSSTGTLLATGTFSGESASGWQQLNFSAPVAITANTTYVASYHSGGAFYYSYAYFQYAGVDNAPLHALKDGVDGPNGVYLYGSGSTFPNQSYLSSNYWVDVVFAQSGPAGPPQSIVAFSGTPQSTAVGTPFAGALQAKVTDASSNPVANVSVTFTAPSSGSTATFGGSNTATAVTNAAGIATSPVPAANSTTGSYTVTASVTGLTAATFTLTNTATVTAATIFSPSAAPTTFYGGSSPVELGVKFRSDANGSITGIRFYKGSGDTGAHTGSLWSSTGTLLATGTFSGESASGWQQLNFSAPVAITANTTYVASYHSGGAFYYSYGYFQNAGVDNAPLHALRDGVDGPNGVYVYGSGSTFPNQSYLSSNYWVDVVFTTP